MRHALLAAVWLGISATVAVAADGTWLTMPSPGRGGHTIVRDPARDRMILHGGSDPFSRNDTWWMPLDGSSIWSPLAVAGTRPSRRLHHSAIFDPVRDRMIVFGGDSLGARFNDVWALIFSGTPTWQSIVPAGTPPSGRTGHAAVYDPVRDRMLVFGGENSNIPIVNGSGGSPLAEVWELTLSGTPQWNQLSPSGSPPQARYFHSMIYDPVRDRLVVFAGQADQDFNWLADAWELTLSGSPAWAPIVPSGTPPEPQTRRAAIYDPVRDGMWIHGPSPAWELRFSPTPAWTQVATPGEPPHAYFYAPAALHDPIRGRMVVHGGEGVQGFLSREHQTWGLDLTALDWDFVGPEVPANRMGHTLVYDEPRGQAILYGGASDWEPVGDAFVLPLAPDQPDAHTWKRLPVTGATPVRFRHSAIFAPSRSSMIVFGGSGEPNDLWELTLAGTPAWAMISAAGTPPGARERHSAIYDSFRDRMIVFGGAGESGFLNDVWALSLSGSPTWTPLAPSGTPPGPRMAHSAVYDPAGDRMIVFGGWNGTIAPLEVWQLTFAPTPAWSLLTPSGTPPNTLHSSTAVHDGIGSRMLVHGGSGNRSAVWAMNLIGPPAWTTLTLPGGTPLGREQHAAAFVSGCRLLTFGGYWANGVGDPNFLADTWELRLCGSTDVPDLARPLASLSPAVPNPTRRSSTIAFTLPSESRVSLSVFDLAGRRLRSLREGVLPAGAHTARWDLTGENGSRVAPGLYLVELRIGRERLTGKTIVLE